MKLINMKQIDGLATKFSDVQTVIDGLNNTYAAKADFASLQKSVFPVKDSIDFSKFETATVDLPLTKKPNDAPITLNINGLIYEETDAFATTKAETGSKLTWTFTSANGGFDITKDLADHGTATYYTGALTDATNVVSIIRADAVPTTGTYKVGDIILKTTPAKSTNLGWICTVAGTPGTWMEIGIADFKETIYPVES